MVHVRTWGVDSLSDRSAGGRFGMVLVLVENVGYGDSVIVYSDRIQFRLL